jgi:hypothetical protein
MRAKPLSSHLLCVARRSSPPLVRPLSAASTERRCAPGSPLLRTGIELSISDTHRGNIGFFDPYPEWATYRLEVKKVRNRKLGRLENLLPIIHQVLDAERSGEKRYLAVEKVSKRAGKTERHVCGALEFTKSIVRASSTASSTSRRAALSLGTRQR